MNTKNFLFQFLILSSLFSAFSVFSQTSNNTALTVLRMTDKFSLLLTDTDSVKYNLTLEETQTFFENAEFVKITRPESMKMMYEREVGYCYLEGEKVSYEFIVDQRNYKIGVGKGTQFIVQKTGDKFTLNPTETIKVSPPPLFQSEIADEKESKKQESKNRRKNTR